MFHDANETLPLPFNPLKALVAPRPIGWISTISAKGEVNLAPYSFFNVLCDRPGVVIFSGDGMKDTLVNAIETREFVCNLATYDFKDAMLATSERIPRGQNEFDHAGLEMEKSVLVTPPRVKGIHAALECKLLQSFEIEDIDGNKTNRHAVMGQVVGTYIDDAFIKDGKVDTASMKLIARLGYYDYAVIDSVFQMRAKDHPGLGPRR